MVHNVILNFCANLVPPTRLGWPSSIPTLLPTLLPSSAHRILKIHRVSLSVSPCRTFRQGQAPLRRRRLPHRHGNESTTHDFPPLGAPCCLASECQAAEVAEMVFAPRFLFAAATSENARSFVWLIGWPTDWPTDLADHCRGDGRDCYDMLRGPKTRVKA